MTKQQKAELKRKISAEIKSIHDDIENSKEEDPALLLGTSEKLDVMENLSQQNVQKRLFLDMQLRLDKLTYALSRIDRDDFGICQICNEPIPYKRLMALPEATMCIECASERN